MGAMRTCFNILDKKLISVKQLLVYEYTLGTSGGLGGNVLRDQHTQGGVCKDS